MPRAAEAQTHASDLPRPKRGPFTALQQKARMSYHRQRLKSDPELANACWPAPGVPKWRGWECKSGSYGGHEPLGGGPSRRRPFAAGTNTTIVARPASARRIHETRARSRTLPQTLCVLTRDWLRAHNHPQASAQMNARKADAAKENPCCPELVINWLELITSKSYVAVCSFRRHLPRSNRTHSVPIQNRELSVITRPFVVSYQIRKSIGNGDGDKLRTETSRTKRL
jgi:hypothetical protein